MTGPPVMSPLSFPPNLQKGSRAQIACSITSGDLPIHFSWLKDGEPLPSSLNVSSRLSLLTSPSLLLAYFSHLHLWVYFSLPSPSSFFFFLYPSIPSIRSFRIYRADKFKKLPTGFSLVTATTKLIWKLSQFFILRLWSEREV